MPMEKFATESHSSAAKPPDRVSSLATDPSSQSAASARHPHPGHGMPDSTGDAEPARTRWSGPVLRRFDQSGRMFIACMPLGPRSASNSTF